MVNHLFLNQSVHAGQFMPSISVLETKEALSFFFYRSVHEIHFLSGYALCWKEKWLHHCFLDQSAQA